MHTQRRIHHPLALVALAALVNLAGGIGCVAESDDETGEEIDAITPNANDAIAFSYFVGRGLTEVQAAGVVGNLDQESRMNPQAVQQGGPGRGIAQWSVGGRWDSLVAYANATGRSAWSLSLQLDYIWRELTSVPAYGLAALRAAPDVVTAVQVFERKFEICGNCQEANRIAYARAALAAFGHQAPSGPVIAMIANTNNVWVAGGAVPADLHLGAMPGTSPAIVQLSGGGYQIAFQANTGNLWTTGTLGTADLGLGMMPGTSPDIVAAGGGYQIAFQANTGNLWTTGVYGTADLGLGMMGGTSPSIIAAGGRYQIAFQANTGNLWTTGVYGTADLHLGMRGGTSPSITAAGGRYQIAFQANTTSLWTTGVYGTADLGLGMMPGTSPSITAAGASYQIAFQANTGNLWTTGALGTADQHLGMRAGTSPAIARLPDGSVEVVFQANTTNLWRLAGGAADLGLGMGGGSPAL